MRVRYLFLDGREQNCFLSKDFPLALIDTLVDHSVGIHAIEILGVL